MSGLGLDLKSRFRAGHKESTKEPLRTCFQVIFDNLDNDLIEILLYWVKIQDCL